MPTKISAFGASKAVIADEGSQNFLWGFQVHLIVI